VLTSVNMVDLYHWVKRRQHDSAAVWNRVVSLFAMLNDNFWLVLLASYQLINQDDIFFSACTLGELSVSTNTEN